MVDRTYSNIDHSVEETDSKMRAYRMILITGVGFTNKQVNKNHKAPKNQIW